MIFITHYIFISYFSHIEFRSLYIQEIFVNPSPFRSRQKVTDVKSDGFPKLEKNLKHRIYVYLKRFHHSKRLLLSVIGSWLCLKPLKLLSLLDPQIQKIILEQKEQITLLFKYRAIYFVFYR
jgi:hypothetical protein